MSRKRSTPSTRPIPSGGTPTMPSINATTGREPAGTPAVPTPPRMHTSITISCCVQSSSMPKNCARNSTVMPSNIAVPFWFAVAPIVSTKRAIRPGRCNRSSATRMAVGNVALDDAVANAITIASCAPTKNAIGERRATNASSSE